MGEPMPSWAIANPGHFTAVQARCTGRAPPHCRSEPALPSPRPPLQSNAAGARLALSATV
eukprot:354267-Chlamydomonas_euryale.AAC.6